jgi:hypothetical protein
MKRVTEQYKELMHYTTIGGLMGIVSTGCLWATHAAFLNDAAEMKHYYDVRLPDVVTEVLRDVIFEQSHSSEVVADAINLDGGIERVVPIEAAAAVRSLRSVTLTFNEPYVFAMSGTADERVAGSGLLSQWRGYGRDGGYCIVFDTERFEKLLSHESKTFHYQSIQWGNTYYYGLDGIQPAMEDMAEAEVDLREGIRSWIDTGGVEATPRFLQAITTLSCMYKHWGFFEEHEVRVVAIPMRADVLDQMTPADREAKPQKPILACSRAGIAVPYLEMFRDLPGIGCRGRLPIKRIIIGPHADAASRRDAIERLLVANGYDAQVSSSEIPYLGR